MKRQTFSILVALSVIIAVGSSASAFAVSTDEACSDCHTDIVFSNEQSHRLKDVPLRMWTDRTLYLYGADVTVQGVVANWKEGMPITITTHNPQGNLIEAQQISLKADGTFTTTIKATGNLWNKDGMYTVRAQYGPQSVNDKATIEIVGSPGTISGLDCDANQIGVKSSTDTYCITYEISGAKITSATVSSESSAVTLRLDTTSDGSLLLIIPRSVLDSRSVSGDSPFVVLADGQPLTVDEIRKDGSSRTISIDFSDPTRDIEIIGTYAVPEFGAMAAVILGVAIISIIAISSRMKLLAVPRL